MSRLVSDTTTSDPISYSCQRSWDKKVVRVAHPRGLASEAWGYADGRAVMARVLRTAVFDDEDPRPFHVTFELAQDEHGHRTAMRQFIVRCDRGDVLLEPLALTYAATFGLSSIFRETPR